MIRFRHPERAGLVPAFFSDLDERSPMEQLDTNYAHGGGFRPIPGFTLRQPLLDDPTSWKLRYPDDPDLRYETHATLAPCGERGTWILVLFQSGFLAMIQDNPEGEYHVTRVD